MVDEIDELILSALSKNSRQDASEMWDILRGHGHSLTVEEIESRITKLEEEGVITGYTISVDMKKTAAQDHEGGACNLQDVPAPSKEDRGAEKILGGRAVCHLFGQDQGRL